MGDRGKPPGLWRIPDMATAAQRAAWRAKKRRQRGQAGPGRDKVLSRKQAVGSAADIAEKPQDLVSYDVSEHLQAIVSNEEFPAAARVNAARTLAEMQGQIGRHQAEPERTVPSLSSLSRDQLVTELEHLRTAIGLGIVR